MHQLPTSSTARKGQTMTLIAAFLGWMFDGLEMGSLMSFFGGSYAKAGATLVFVYLIGMTAI